MTTTIPKFTAALSLVLAAGACATEETDPGAYRSTTTIANSPHANEYDVPELSLVGEPNADGVTLVGFRDQNNDVFGLDSVDDELIMLDAQGNPWKAGSNLVGARIELSNGQGGTEYIHVLGHTTAKPMWTDTPQFMSAYALAYQPPGSTNFVNICPGFADDPTAKVVTIITGERYDADTKTVIAGETDWITLACQDQGVFKMKRLGYGPNNGDSDPDERSATLKMITAAYCGHSDDFKSYTAQGTEIVWADAAGTVNEWDATVTQLEAVWDEEGAVCWNTHRRADMVPECDPVPCTGNEIGVWTTWLPPP